MNDQIDRRNELSCGNFELSVFMVALARVVVRRMGRVGMERACAMWFTMRVSFVGVAQW